MNILFAASEAVPFVKSGGLADVIGSLPVALTRGNADVRVILPKYEEIPEEFKEKLETIATFSVWVGWRNQYVGIQHLEWNGIHWYFIDNEYYFRRRGLYGYDDDPERFAFFSIAVLEALPRLDFKPDIIHSHDWQTGLIPYLIRTRFSWDKYYHSIKTVFSIHNLRYQGRFSKELFKDILGVGDNEFIPGHDGLEFYGDGNCVKAAISFADKITTVSKTYAEEIQTSYFGEHLDGLLRWRSGDLTGIVNGIDNDLFDPMKDTNLVENYRNSLSKKRKNKTALQEELGLPVDETIPVIGIVSRLVEQKGIDLIKHVLDDIVAERVQLVVIGTGLWDYEQLFRFVAWKYPDKISANILFDEPLSRRIYAGSDFFLMPSRFEPCGLGQLIALRYRTVPIVRETGGLKDTVQPFNEYTDEGTGFTFANYNAHELLFTIQRALRVYENADKWEAIIRNISKVDYGWDQSAKQYLHLYKQLV